MKCPKCKKGKLRKHVNVFVETDAEDHNLNKRGMRKRSVQILGVGWDKAVFFCTNPLCGLIYRDGLKPEAG